MVEESLEVSEGSCSKGAWRQFFESTGEIFCAQKSEIAKLVRGIFSRIFILKGRRLTINLAQVLFGIAW